MNPEKYTQAKLDPEILTVRHNVPPGWENFPAIDCYRGTVALMDSAGATLGREEILAYAHLFARSPALDRAYQKACALVDALVAFQAADIKKRRWGDIMDTLEAFREAKAHVEAAIARPDEYPEPIPNSLHAQQTEGRCADMIKRGHGMTI